MAEEYTPPPRAVGRDAVFVRHRLSSPRVAESAYIAPTAVLSGDVTVGAHSRVLFGAVVTARRRAGFGGDNGPEQHTAVRAHRHIPTQHRGRRNVGRLRHPRA